MKDKESQSTLRVQGVRVKESVRVCPISYQTTAETAVAHRGLLCATAVSAVFDPPEGACFRTAAEDYCYRWCGPSETVADAVVRTALRLAPALTDGGADAWLSGHDLAPCHWFSHAAADEASS
jgi:hypothetical protein